jgi:hypothetical protein
MSIHFFKFEDRFDYQISGCLLGSHELPSIYLQDRLTNG